MKNSLSDLTNHLFAALERLNDESLAPEVVRGEIQRANAIAVVAREIIGAGNLAVLLIVEKSYLRIWCNVICITLATIKSVIHQLAIIQ